MSRNSDLAERAERLAKLTENADEARLDLKAAYDAAASQGYSKAALRKAVKIHMLDGKRRAKHEQEQTDLELYLAEIEGRQIDTANTVTEASIAFLQQSRKIREAAE